MAKRSEGLLRRVTEAHGVPGLEVEVREVFRGELEGAGDFATDRNGSIMCDLGGEGPRVLLAAHMDEVGFRVQAVTEPGFLKLVPVGGWWPHVVLGQQVEVLTAGGMRVTGVVGSKPPHFLSDEERKKVVPLDKMFVDIGAGSRAEVEEWGVRIGDPVAPRTSFEEMARKGRFVAKAFDNRAGMAAVVEAGRRLARIKRGNRALLAGTVQEEVGLRGAQTLAALAEPDAAVVLEGTPADDTPGFSEGLAQGALGEGVQIRLHDPSAVMSPALVRLAVETAEKEGIRHQLAVRKGGGTDAGRLQLAGRGVPCVVLGVPARYIHSHNSVMDLADYEAMVALSVALLRRLDGDAVRKLAEF